MQRVEASLNISSKEHKRKEGVNVIIRQQSFSTFYYNKAAKRNTRRPDITWYLPSAVSSTRPSADMDSVELHAAASGTCV